MTMNKLIVLSISFLTISLSGCSSTISAWKARPAAQHNLTTGEFWTLTGERRLAIFTKRPGVDGTPVWCAESLPEASMAITSSSAPKIDQASKITVSADDKFSTTLTQTSTRTEIAEIFRQMSFLNCQAFALGAFDEKDYRDSVVNLNKVGIAVITNRSLQVLTDPTDKKTTGTTPTTPAKIPTAAEPPPKSVH